MKIAQDTCCRSSYSQSVPDFQFGVHYKQLLVLLESMCGYIQIFGRNLNSTLNTILFRKKLFNHTFMMNEKQFYI